MAHLNTLATKRCAEERRVASIAGVVKVRYEAPDVTIIILARTGHARGPLVPRLRNSVPGDGITAGLE